MVCRPIITKRTHVNDRTESHQLVTVLRAVETIKYRTQNSLRQRQHRLSVCYKVTLQILRACIRHVDCGCTTSSGICRHGRRPSAMSDPIDSEDKMCSCESAVHLDAA